MSYFWSAAGAVPSGSRAIRKPCVGPSIVCRRCATFAGCHGPSRL